jgi:hypothetical protein
VATISPDTKEPGRNENGGGSKREALADFELAGIYSLRSCKAQERIHHMAPYRLGDENMAN